MHTAPSSGRSGKQQQDLHPPNLAEVAAASAATGATAVTAATASTLSTAKNFARAIAVAERTRARAGERGLGMGWLASAKWRGGCRVS